MSYHSYLMYIHKSKKTNEPAFDAGRARDGNNIGLIL